MKSFIPVPNQYGSFNDGEISDDLSIKSNPATPAAINDENLEETLSETSLKIDKKSKKPKKLKTKNRKEQHDSTRPTFECTACDQTFDRRESFLRHKRLHHTPGTFQCNHCAKHFVRKRNLLRHMKIHKGTGNVSIEPQSKHELCPFCGKSYSQTSLAIHIRRHTGEKPYKCDICDKGYPRSHDLMIHKRSHTGERPHVCPTCGKAFIRPNKLARHIRVHTGERPYKCTQCGKGFAQSNDLNLHIRRHTGEKPYKCGVCQQAFINGTALRNHHKSTDHYSIKDQCPDRFEKIRVDNPYRQSYQTCWRTKTLNTKQDIEVVKACSDENNGEQGAEDLSIYKLSTDWTAHN